MSHLMFGTLKFIREHDVHTEHVKLYHMGTIGSLLKRGYIARNGTRVILTDKGEQAFDSYYRAGVNYRKTEGEISERVSLMLNLRYAISISKKAS